MEPISGWGCGHKCGSGSSGESSLGFEETHSGFSHGDAVVPHVELLVHLHSFVDGVLQARQSIEGFMSIGSRQQRVVV